MSTKTFPGGRIRKAEHDAATKELQLHFDNGNVLAYTPAVQLTDEEGTTKVFPTVVTGSTFYVQTGQPYERLQVVNSFSQPVYEKGLDSQSGTITVGLPSLPRGVYFVRLLSERAPQHVQRILIN